jgi:hypothetical protein
VYAVQEYAFSKGPYVVTVYPDLLQAYAKGWTGFVSKHILRRPSCASSRQRE